jgi:hypothetical protein
VPEDRELPKFDPEIIKAFERLIEAFKPIPRAITKAVDGIARVAALQTHRADACAGQACCIHNPSEHGMRDFPLHWRGDRGLMERTCPHGVGHPDPDDLSYKRRAFGEGRARADSIHGCDGCCAGG